MADEQEENRQELQQEEALSILDRKRKELLDEVEDLIQQLGEDFGPIFQGELQRRLEFVVQNFNQEVKALFAESFDKWHVKDTQLRDLMDDSIQMLESQSVKRNPQDVSTPDFIKDVEFGPVRPK